jgi:hypothetical protein
MQQFREQGGIVIDSNCEPFLMVFILRLDIASLLAVSPLLPTFGSPLCTIE